MEDVWPLIAKGKYHESEKGLRKILKTKRKFKYKIN